jgi:hypothetical protein
MVPLEEYSEEDGRNVSREAQDVQNVKKSEKNMWSEERGEEWKKQRKKKSKKHVRENVIQKVGVQKQKVSPERSLGVLCNALLPRPAHLSHQFPFLPTGQECVELYFHLPIWCGA